MGTIQKVSAQRIVAIMLVLVFVVTMIGLGFRPHPRAAVNDQAKGQVVDTIKPDLPELIQRNSLDEQLDKLLNSQTVKAIPPIELPVFAYTADKLEDPFASKLPKLHASAPEVTVGAGQPVTSPPMQPPHLSVQGLVWGGAVPEVIIDGAVYTVGDTVHGAKVLSIDREGITVELQGSTFAFGVSKNLGSSRSP